MHLSANDRVEVKMRGGDYYVPASIQERDGRLYFSFAYCPPLIDEIKSLSGRKWHPEEKQWSAPINERNLNALQLLTKGASNPFTRYDQDIIPFTPKRKLWKHQEQMFNFIMTRRRCILAAEQGTGKTLPMIEAMEASGYDTIWYCAPVSGKEAVRLELIKWNSTITPDLMTYERLKKRLNEEPPRILIGDECQNIKNANSQRGDAFLQVTAKMREVYEDDCYIILASGTPAPHNPTDWWSQCEACCPGFLKEPNANLMKYRMGLWVEGENTQGYKELVTWWDNEKKCAHCGLYHENGTHEGCEGYKPSINECALLYERMDGLTLVIKKKDCMNLPDKHYKKIHCKPSEHICEMAAKIKEYAATPIEALTSLRALSDGFQYTQEIVGELTCPYCSGSGEGEDYEILDDEFSYEEVDGECVPCGGSGVLPKYKRTFEEVSSPKLRMLENILHQEEENGRLIVYAAFQASIDRIKKFCLDNYWAVFIADGRKWYGTLPDGTTLRKENLVDLFQDKNREIKRVVWLANPRAAGTGLTLTESPIEIFYSNSFNAADRMQAEDRAHRAGMDENRGLTIIDLICLPVDELVSKNIGNKRFIQDLTLGQIEI